MLADVSHDPSRLVFVAAGFLAGIAYLTLCWRISGRTFGDQVIGLRVVGRGGRPFRFVGALGISSTMMPPSTRPPGHPECRMFR